MLPTPHPCLWGVDSSEPLPPGCRGLGKDTALPRRGLSPLLGVRVPMLGGGGPWVCGQGLRFSVTLPHHVCAPCPPSYATDLVVCVALGCDMFDCVFPTRTAVSWGRGRTGEGVQGWG